MRMGHCCDRARARILAILLTWLLSGAAASADPLLQAPVAPYTTADGRLFSTSSFKGHRTMLWLVSTWCESCSAGIKALADNHQQLKKSGLRIVILRNYLNDGYPGPEIRRFVTQVVPQPAEVREWTLGEASPQLEHTYNRRDYPDVYFLIDANGRLAAVDGAPAATIDHILRFARSGKP